MSAVGIGLCVWSLIRLSTKRTTRTERALKTDSKLTEKPSLAEPDADTVPLEADSSVVDFLSSQDLGILSHEGSKQVLVKARIASIRLRQAEEAAEWEREAQDIIARQFTLFPQMPKYEAVRSDVLPKAEEMLASLDPSDENALLELVQKEFDAFWEKGALAEEDAYEHGFLARALLELTRDEHCDSFAFLDFQKEAINVTRLLYRLKEGDREASRKEIKILLEEELLPIIDRQAEIIFSDNAEPSTDTIIAMLDWVRFAKGRNVDATPGWKWLIDNVETCECSGMKQLFQKGLESGSFPIELYMPITLRRHSDKGRERALLEEMLDVAPIDIARELEKLEKRPDLGGGTIREYSTLMAERTGRLLLSFKGSPKFRANRIGLWKHGTHPACRQRIRQQVDK